MFYDFIRFESVVWASGIESGEKNPIPKIFMDTFVDLV